jgi:D-alanyl-D-alanine dipeptidase
LLPVLQNSVIISAVNKSHFFRLVFLFCLNALSLVPTITLQAQSSGASATSLSPGSKPPDVPAEWKQLVGIYRYGEEKGTVIILERDNQLFLQNSQGAAQQIQEQTTEQERILWLDGGDGRRYGFTEDRDATGSVIGFGYLLESYTRVDAGSDPSRFYHVQPLKPIAQLRATALAEQPPEEPGPFRKPELVELVKMDSAFHLDIRYAQDNNFLSTPVYSQARAFMQRPAAEALARVLRKLEPVGYGLLIHDAYRPWYVTKIFWDATPAEGKIFVADPKKGSRHNRGCAVDLTLYDLTTGKPIEMPSLYDEMSPRSFPNFPGGTSLERWHRDLLRRAMELEGFTVNEDEWWHFGYKDWKSYAILNVGFEDLGGLKP